MLQKNTVNLTIQTQQGNILTGWEKLVLGNGFDFYDIVIVW
jgi:hypothetical protein